MEEWDLLTFVGKKNKGSYREEFFHRLWTIRFLLIIFALICLKNCYYFNPRAVCEESNLIFYLLIFFFRAGDIKLIVELSVRALICEQKRRRRQRESGRMHRYRYGSVSSVFAQPSLISALALEIAPKREGLAAPNPNQSAGGGNLAPELMSFWTGLGYGGWLLII